MIGKHFKLFDFKILKNALVKIMHAKIELQNLIYLSEMQSFSLILELHLDFDSSFFTSTILKYTE